MAGLGRIARVPGVSSGGQPSPSIVDPVAERRRDATILLRRNKRACAQVIVWNVVDSSILWIDRLGQARTSFAYEVDGDLRVSPTYEGFVV